MTSVKNGQEPFYLRLSLYISIAIIFVSMIAIGILVGQVIDLSGKHTTMVCLQNHTSKTEQLNEWDKVTYYEPKTICDVWVYKLDNYTSDKYYSYEYQVSHNIQSQELAK